MYLNAEKKQEIFGQYGKSNTDTGSAESQIALFSYRISHLTEHLKAEGFGRRCDYKLPVGNFTLCDTLPTTIALMHRIDRPVLKGIREVGIYASTPIGQSGEVVWEVDWNK